MAGKAVIIVYFEEESKGRQYKVELGEWDDLFSQ